MGQPLPPWQEGYLDIHAINTGRGECTLLILPDGTTLAIDAGEFSREPDSYRAVAQKPDTLTRPTHVYAAYMRHFMPYRDSLDYMLVTHFHMDHFGQLEPEYKRSAAGDYLLSGVTALYEELPFRELVDRAWPAYDSLACRARSSYTSVSPARASASSGSSSTCSFKEPPMAASCSGQRGQADTSQRPPPS